MPRDPRTEELIRQVRLQLPRILVLLGICLLVAGVIATVAFVATDSGCNAATNLNSPGGIPTRGAFCGHEGGFLGISFVTLVVGAVLIGLGGMVLPTLRDRDARRARQKAASSTPPPES
ncbi:MAG: hypothetical protein ACLPVF_02535 [Acidimicrobiales bacterium]